MCWYSVSKIIPQTPSPFLKKGESWINYINQPGHVLSESFMGEKYSVTENWLVGITSFEIYLYSVGTICITRKNIGHIDSKGEGRIIRGTQNKNLFGVLSNLSFKRLKEASADDKRRKKWLGSHLGCERNWESGAPSSIFLISNSKFIEIEKCYMFMMMNTSKNIYIQNFQMENLRESWIFKMEDQWIKPQTKNQ